MKRLVFDLDNTLTCRDDTLPYPDKKPNLPLIAKLRDYKAAGFEIIIQTARNMKTYNNSVGQITAHTLPVILTWLACHDIPYDEIHVGKPWCGQEGFYVDDRAIRPKEFVLLSMEQIHLLLATEA